MIVNTEVTKAALSQDGLWMATVEQRDDEVSNMEVRLKFWKFDTETQMWVVNNRTNNRDFDDLLLFKVRLEHFGRISSQRSC